MIQITIRTRDRDDRLEVVWIAPDGSEEIDVIPLDDPRYEVYEALLRSDHD